MNPATPALDFELSSLRLRPKARALFVKGMAPGEFLGKLIEAEFHTEAIRLIARLLPRREAIWWACLCVRHSLGEAATKAEVAGLATIARGARDAGSAQPIRVLAGQLASEDSPLAMLARASAAATSDAAGRMLGEIVNRAAQAAGDCQRQFVAIGLEVSLGKLPWN